jgi:PBP1b-binding outer membrane lipoprotein LpoB
MRYLALVALLAFVMVPFLAGCSEKPAAPKPVEKDKAPVVAPEKVPDAPKAPDAPAAPVAPKPAEPAK